MPGKILVVDDLAANRELIREALDDCADQISEAPTASQALEHLQRYETDLVITDVRMPGMSGIELLERLHRDHPDVVVVVMSAFASVSLANSQFGTISRPFRILVSARFSTKRMN